MSKSINEILDEKQKEALKKITTGDQSSLKSKSVYDVLNDLKNIEKENKDGGNIDAPDSLGLQKVEVENKTDEELNELAKNSLDAKYKAKKDSTNESFERQIKSLLEQNEAAKEQAAKQQNSVNEVFDNSIKQTENQALKRGLARSSVIINQVAGLEGSRANELAGILKSINDNLSNTEARMSELEEEKNKALDNLDIEYALELAGEIENVKNQYNKQRQQAIEFNNNVEKLEAEYKLKLEDQKLQNKKQLALIKDQYGADYLKEQIRNSQYDYLKNYLDSLDKSYAVDLLTGYKEFLDILGQSRYDLLLSYEKER